MQTELVKTAAPPGDFAAASAATLRFLHEHMGFNLWVVTRTDGKNWIALHTEDHGYGLPPNVVLPWADSLCSRMVAGVGPRVAPDVNAVPAYAEALHGRGARIQAYIGVPLTFSGNSSGKGAPGTQVFGTLCAFHPTSQPESIAKELPLIELLGEMLSSILNYELGLVENGRRLERARSDAEIDAMTRLYNRRGWNRLLEAEENRCYRYGHSACVIAIDLDDLKEINDSKGHAAGDELLCTAASTIQQNARDFDVVARLGGDEFSILGIECNEASAEQLSGRIRTALDENGVCASLGLAMREPSTGLARAQEEADQRMYADKANRQRLRLRRSLS